MESETRSCQNCKTDFIIESEDFNFYEKIKVPPPTFCPECRLQRRMVFRNERTLYKRTCDICQQKVISLYPADTTFPVFCNHCWYGDKWDPETYGQDYDPFVSFFEQFKNLMRAVPRPALIGDSNVNSPYVNYAANLKNCYLVNCSDTCENSAYSDRIFYSKEAFDCFGVANSEFCCESNQCLKMYKVGFADNSENSIESIGLKNCHSVSDCLFCINLRSKNNFFLNEKISEQEYDNIRKNIGSYVQFEKVYKEFKDLSLKVPHRFANNVLAVNSDGNELFGVKNCHNSFFVRDSENLQRAYYCSKIKDSRDFNFADNSELIYESSNIEQNYLKLFSTTCWYSNNISYSDLCLSSSDIFGSVGLRNKKYCILNKSYSKEDYETLKNKIITDMSLGEYRDKNGHVYKYGEFFPTEISPFSYNETIAQDHFPLEKEEIIKKGYSWKEPEAHKYEITKYVDDLPDHIEDVKDDFVQNILECGHKGKCNHGCPGAFRLVPKEIQFYKQINLPLPRYCPNCRYHIRLSERNPIKLWDRRCNCSGDGSENGLYKNTVTHIHGKDKCDIEFKTSYAPDRPEIVYCEKCYQQEVY